MLDADSQLLLTRVVGRCKYLLTLASPSWINILRVALQHQILINDNLLTREKGFHDKFITKYFFHMCIIFKMVI